MIRGKEILLCSFAEKEVMHKEIKLLSYIKEQIKRDHMSYSESLFICLFVFFFSLQ